MTREMTDRYPIAPILQRKTGQKWRTLRGHKASMNSTVVADDVRIDNTTIEDESMKDEKKDETSTPNPPQKKRPIPVETSSDSSRDAIGSCYSIKCRILSHMDWFGVTGFLSFFVVLYICIRRWKAVSSAGRSKTSGGYGSRDFDLSDISTEYDNLLAGVFESDQFTDYDPDSDEESIESILSSWSAKYKSEIEMETLEEEDDERLPLDEING
mmetsp:Transcript_48572/g.72063  ORF Transcript_48572/g.72063 Transcript_48572/m.72063 type:complete len:213 (-) Transcript_48572:155-793(-)|eukprot:CAMPEP_0195518358 /NCGR_PEP_ID=MMETSP0794_2-20130614/12712_1 /TAXON_ID=515487 /ORGANISM="Stephanopyxis turris, Strain CCMP 815" /LENGTH=212 /DNA_ID=CAMNT_0040647307 /DNA_START=117 /DNA_END=755 /DNA_ORIENTATION=+